ncbi:MAG: phosphatase PAP2 family protein, partial [Solirubrobacteraceae bacterium]|nr:phosphatase PAP2 family protein [Solirubrobacteraceae bacterium]
SFGTVADYAGRGAFALGTVIVVVVAIVGAVRWLRDPANRARARAWLDAQAQRPALRPLVWALRPVTVHVVAPVARRLAGPVRFTVQRFTPGDLGLEVTTLAAVAAVGSFGFFALGFSVGPGEPLLATDRRAAEWATELYAPWLVDVAKVVTAFGSAPVLIAGALLACAVLARWRAWLGIAVLVAGMVATSLAVHLAKATVDRPRPDDALVATEGSAYPSGHSANAVAWIAIAVLLARVVPRLAGQAGVVVAAAVLTALVGLSRVYLHAHWWSDVVGGWGLGVTIFAGCGILGLLVAHMSENRGRR